jgi:hypothetical protein
MRTAAIQIDERSYGQLLRQTLLHVIHSDDELQRLTNELMRLDAAEDPTREKKELAELLTVLIEEYEERRYPIGRAVPDRYCTT